MTRTVGIDAGGEDDIRKVRLVELPDVEASVDSSGPRFRAIRVFQRNCKPIAEILDSKAGRHLYVHQIQGGSYTHWDRLDLPVAHKPVRELAREMLLEAKLEGQS